MSAFLGFLIVGAVLFGVVVGALVKFCMYAAKKGFHW